VAPSFTATYSMIPIHFMGTSPSIFHNGMKNYGTQSTPWVSSHSLVDMPSPLQSSPWSTYMSPRIGSRGTMASMPMSLFDMSHVPQPSFTTKSWNLPSYGSSPSYAFSGANTQMGSYSNNYTPPMFPSSTMLNLSNTCPMTSPHISPGTSYEENQLYDSSYPLYGTPSQAGNIYLHSNNPYHTFVSSQTSVMILIQTYLNQLNGGYYLSRQG
jgi:hypothetical protein